MSDRNYHPINRDEPGRNAGRKLRDYFPAAVARKRQHAGVFHRFHRRGNFLERAGSEEAIIAAGQADLPGERHGRLTPPTEPVRSRLPKRPAQPEYFRFAAIRPPVTPFETARAPVKARRTGSAIAIPLLPNPGAALTDGESRSGKSGNGIPPFVA